MSSLDPSSSSSSSPSFYTALGSPVSIEMEGATSNGHAPLPRYRSAIPITDVIRTHCHVNFDEKQYGLAIGLLQDLVAPGAANPDCARPIMAPLPLHIELASALLIHPAYTNQATPEYVELSSRCLTFLRNLLTILGPINARLDEAFSFSQERTGRNLRRSRNRADLEDGSSGSETEEGFDHPKGVIANNGRIRKCAEDFWHMVGWALNCSVKYPKRWRYWKVWLEYMLDVLDADWFEREEQDLVALNIFDADLGIGPVDGCEYNLCRKSLLVTYLSDAKGKSGPMKRIIRCAFVDGSEESIKEFPEVWENETRDVKLPSGQKRKRDTPEFGDCDQENENSFSSDMIEEVPELSQETEETELDPWLGGPESIILRQRVVTLLSRVAAYLPGEFANLTDVYDTMYINIKSLPLPAFSFFFSPSKTNPLPNVVFVSLTSILLLRLLPMNAPQPHTISEFSNDNLSQDIIERCFLPFPANTYSVVDNAKISILVESVLRFFFKLCGWLHTPSLDSAIEIGVTARENKAKGDRKKRDYGVKKKEDEEAWMWLKASGERLRRLRAWVEANSQEEVRAEFERSSWPVFSALGGYYIRRLG